MLNIGATCTYFVFCMPTYIFYYKASTDLKLFYLAQFICEQCCGSGSGSSAFFEPDRGSGMGFFRIPDLGSQTHIFESLVTIFLGKKFFNSIKSGTNFFFSISEIKYFSIL